MNCEIEFLINNDDLIYFEELTEAAEWYYNYLKTYPGDEVECIYFEVGA